MGLSRMISKMIAKNFGLQNKEDVKIFKKHWKLVKKSRKYYDKNEKKLKKAIKDSFYYLARHLLRHGECFYRGTGSIARDSVDKKYVIFSDHHYLPSNNRHNYFQKYNNYKMYRKLLEQYYDNDYTLVENGDVEDLVIFEPTLRQAKARRQMTWSELNADRLGKRRRQLSRIIDDYEDLYDQIRESFQREGRFIKLLGNHDKALDDTGTLRILRRKYRGLRVYDYLSLEHDPTLDIRRSRPAFLVAHGHQFDQNTHPLYADRLGEVISECLGWAFQGADRIWEWKDGPKQWVEGQPYQNELVTSKAEGKGSVLEFLQDNHEIAWEYFESKHAMGALMKEILTGDEFFKYRHTSETFIRDQLRRYWPDQNRRPTLILGHTHEPRVDPRNPRTGRTFQHYANCGSAGRYANLIWGIEVEQGEVRVVSWHYRHREPNRQVYRVLTNRRNALRASRALHTPLG